MAHVRTFIAVELPGAVRETLAGVTNRLRGQVGEVRWVQPEGIHLTLKFLGDVETERIPDVVSAVRAAAGEVAAFTLRTTHLGGFPVRDRARVLWVGLEGDVAALADLQGRVEGALVGLGFEKERREFSPHLTLGRARKQPVSLPEDVLDPEAVSFRVERVTVMKSDLQPGGAVYTPQGYGPLAG